MPNPNFEKLFEPAPLWTLTFWRRYFRKQKIKPILDRFHQSSGFEKVPAFQLLINEGATTPMAYLDQNNLQQLLSPHDVRCVVEHFMADKYDDYDICKSLTSVAEHAIESDNVTLFKWAIEHYQDKPYSLMVMNGGSYREDERNLSEDRLKGNLGRQLFSHLCSSNFFFRDIKFIRYLMEHWQPSELEASLSIQTLLMSVMHNKQCIETHQALLRKIGHFLLVHQAKLSINDIDSSVCGVFMGDIVFETFFGDPKDPVYLTPNMHPDVIKMVLLKKSGLLKPDH